MISWTIDKQNCPDTSTEWCNVGDLQRVLKILGTGTQHDEDRRHTGAIHAATPIRNISLHSR